MTGSDQLYHKRKARRLKDQKRKIACRDPYPTVLIVCEGEKTEKNYFDELVHDLKLNTANVKVAKNSFGSAPKSVVECALETYNNSSRYFEKIYCVIDKDRHDSYTEALQIAKRAKLKSKHTIDVITSIPCFEYWLLLHFRYTCKNYYSGPGSVCARVIADLKRCENMSRYEKGDRNIYTTLKSRLLEAIHNSGTILQNCQNSGTDNPSTKIHELVLFLQNIKSIPIECGL